MTRAVKYALRISRGSKRRKPITDEDKKIQKVNDVRAVFRAE